MKKPLLYLTLLLSLFFLFSCSSDKYKGLFTDYLQTHDGTKYDLKVKFSKFDLSDVTIQDSIDILNDIYEKEKAKKLERVQSLITLEETSINNYKERLKSNPNNFMIPSSLAKAEERLDKLLINKANIEEWKADYLNKYEGRNPKDILAKKAEVKFSYDDPIFKTRAEESGTALMNLDATKVLRYRTKK